MRKLTKEQFIEKAKKMHGDRYDYSKVNYINTTSKVEIICPIHGSFWQMPWRHYEGKGCPECGYLMVSKNKSKNTNQFIKEARQIHGNRYDYSKSIYKHALDKITIICPKHGEFNQIADVHLRGRGCNKCRYDYLSKLKTYDKTTFINKANHIHDYLYDYSKVQYVDSLTKVTIICPIHGEFKQCPNMHLAGNGCPKCKMSKNERKISNYLNSKHIKNIYQHRFNDCRGRIPLPFDFYLPDYNVCIEYDGEQHFKILDYIGENEYNKTLHHDQIKTNYCKQNNIKLLRIPYTEANNIEEILRKELNLND